MIQKSGLEMGKDGVNVYRVCDWKIGAHAMGKRERGKEGNQIGSPKDAIVMATPNLLTTRSLLLVSFMQDKTLKHFVQVILVCIHSGKTEIYMTLPD